MGSFDSLTSAISGLEAQSFALQNISNNIANSQTTAYKLADTSFRDLLASQLDGIESQDGVRAMSRIDFTQGAVESSSIGTFMAINGDGYFAVARPTTDSSGQPNFASSSTVYTRVGDFQPNGSGYLINSSGDYLMGNPVDPATGNPTNGAPQPLQFNSASLPTGQGTLDSLSVGSNGLIQGTFSNGKTIDLAGIPLTSFNGDGFLQRGEGGTFIPTPLSGPALANTSGRVVGNALEASNVDITDQFTTLILTQQAYTANTRVVTSSIEMLQTLTAMIR